MSRGSAHSALTDLSPPVVDAVSLHDALPLSRAEPVPPPPCLTLCPYSEGYVMASRNTRARIARESVAILEQGWRRFRGRCRSEELTSELQSRRELVCRLLPVEKKRLTRQPLT